MGRIQRSMCAGMLGLEAVVLFLTIPVMLTLTDVSTGTGIAVGTVLTVADDGVGVRHAAPGTGLRTMRERAERHGGWFEVRAADTGGALVQWAVPIRAAAGTSDPSVVGNLPLDAGRWSLPPDVEPGSPQSPVVAQLREVTR